MKEQCDSAESHGAENVYAEITIYIVLKKYLQFMFFLCVGVCG